MKKIFVIIGMMLLAMPIAIKAQKSGRVTARNAQVKKLAEGFKFTEGPAVDMNGNVYFTDQPNDQVLVWPVDAAKLMVLEGDAAFGGPGLGRANGLYFDRDGRLLSCSDLENEIWSIDMAGEHTVLVADFDGKKLNGPNDLWVHPGNGSIYFTDPLYKRNYWTRSPEMQQDGEHVYCLMPDRKTLVRVATDLKKPNGIVGTPDGKQLYVADIGDDKTWVYNIMPDGSLTGKKLFAPMGSDGMTIDVKGNIYLTGKGVTVFNRKGEKIEHIPVEAGWTANVCFGGKDMKTLFITASQYLYCMQMKVKGVTPH